MTEQHHYTREAPRSRSNGVRVSDFTLLVRVPGSPQKIRAFTDSERSEAEEYAAHHGGTVVPLPLPPPAGYTNDEHGNLVPITDH